MSSTDIERWMNEIDKLVPKKRSRKRDIQTYRSAISSSLKYHAKKWIKDLSGLNSE